MNAPFYNLKLSPHKLKGKHAASQTRPDQLPCSTGHYIQAYSCLAVRSGKKSPNQETGLGNRGLLKVLNDTKFVLNEHD